MTNQKENFKQRYIESSKWIEKYKLKQKCFQCGWNDNPHILVIRKKNFNEDKTRQSILSWGTLDNVKQRLDDYVFVCRNCNVLINQKLKTEDKKWK